MLPYSVLRPARYTSDPTSEPCTAGTFRSSDMLTCGRCEGHSISTQRAAECTQCESGEEANELKTVCGAFFKLQLQFERLCGVNNDIKTFNSFQFLYHNLMNVRLSCPMGVMYVIHEIA